MYSPVTIKVLINDNSIRFSRSPFLLAPGLPARLLRPLLRVHLLLVRVPVGIRVESLRAEETGVQGLARVLGHVLGESGGGPELLSAGVTDVGLPVGVVVAVHVAPQCRLVRGLVAALSAHALFAGRVDAGEVLAHGGFVGKELVAVVTTHLGRGRLRLSVCRCQVTL